MTHMELIASLAQPADTKILLLVLDGLGGLPDATGRTELERARIPNLDRFASDAVTGLHDPVAPGVTPRALREAPPCRLAALSPRRGPMPAPGHPRRVHGIERWIRNRTCETVH